MRERERNEGDEERKKRRKQDMRREKEERTRYDRPFESYHPEN
jgi:hypothetical protein